MTGVLDGIDVLDLTTGIARPDDRHVAGRPRRRGSRRSNRPAVTRRAPSSGAQVWHRGKRSAVLDLHDGADHDRLIALASRADVLVESYSPGTTARLGLDFDALHAVNPRLVYCSITAYGDDGRHADRPGYDHARRSTRTGHQWESRGVPGGTLARLGGVAPAFPDLVVPDDCWVAAPRPGPLFSGVPWISVASCYLATLAISAALRACASRRGGGNACRRRCSRVYSPPPFRPGNGSNTSRPRTSRAGSATRAPKGVFRSADGRWIHQSVPLPDFVISAAEGDRVQRTAKTTRPREATTRASAWTSTRCSCSTTTSR